LEADGLRAVMTAICSFYTDFFLHLISVSRAGLTAAVDLLSPKNDLLNRFGSKADFLSLSLTVVNMVNQKYTYLS
jgi:hypothetical protein